MSDSNLDWTGLAEQTEPNPIKYRFADVQHRFRKVAFDVYKSIGGNSSDACWEMRTEADGTKYLYAIYEEPEALVATASSDWSAISDRSGRNITLAYKGAPLMRYASAQHGFE